MEIDWFTVTAQLVNFLILVWLLKRFLYGPIVDAMDTREARISERLESAEQREQEARDQIDEYKQKQQELEREKDDVLDSAREEARSERNELLEKARNEVQRAKDEWYASLQREQRTVLDDIRSQTERQLFETIRRVLDDLADEELERRIVEVFITQVTEADDAELPTFGDEDGSARDLTVRTSVELTEDQRARLTDTLNARFGQQFKLAFDLDESLIGGIEIRSHGRRFGWSIRQYLESLEHTLDSRLQERLELSAPADHTGSDDQDAGEKAS